MDFQERDEFDSIKPVVVVSACLGFRECRWNGVMINEPLISWLKNEVEFLPVCPESEIGLGIPRAPIRCVLDENDPEKIRLIQPRTGADCTDAMDEFLNAFLDRLGEVDGFLLKSVSPTCGRENIKIYQFADRPNVSRRGEGIFTRLIRQRWEPVPIEDEGRMHNYLLREHWLTSIFTLARLRAVGREGRMRALVHFQAENKYLLMSLSQSVLQRLGRLVANHEKLPFETVYTSYRAALFEALVHPPSVGARVCVLEHLYGYFSDQLSSAERDYFFDLLEEFRRGAMPLSTPIGLIQSWALRFEDEYILRQRFLSPYPTSLVHSYDTASHKIPMAPVST